MKNITADTTDADILAPLEAARESLVTMAQGRGRAEDLAAAALAVCEAEGMAAARIAYRNTLVGAAKHRGMSTTHPEVRAVAEQAVTDLVLAGADDTWSGRGNDARRARYDGTRKAARELLPRY